MPPPVATASAPQRKPYPKSLVPLAELEGITGDALATLSRRKRALVPPAAHRRTPKSPLEVRVRASVLSILDVNLVAQTFRCQFVLVASWVETSFEGGELPSVDDALSDQKRGWLVTDEDTEHYCARPGAAGLCALLTPCPDFAPMLRLRNLVSQVGQLEEEYSVALEETDDYGSPVADPKPVVSYRLAGTGTFSTLFTLSSFPLDSQTFAIELMSLWDKAHVRLKRNLRDDSRSVVSRETFTQSEEYELAGQLHLLNHETDPAHSSSGTTYSLLEVQMHVRRRLVFWTWNVWLPLFWFTGLSFSCFLSEVTNVAARLSITLAILLTLVSYRFSIMDKLPSVDYLTALDLYFQLCFGVVFAVSGMVVAVAYRAENDQADWLGNNWQQPSAWQGSQRAGMLHVSIAWLSLNVSVPLGVLLTRRVQRSTEALHWWDHRENVVWLGPLDEKTARRLLTSPALQRALTEAAEALRPFSQGGGREAATAAAEAAEAAKHIAVATVRLVRPEELIARSRNTKHAHLVPRTRQPFLLVEVSTQASAYAALGLFRDAEAADAAALAEEMAAERRGEPEDAPPPPPSGSLQALLRACRLENRRVSAEMCLPEYKHLLVNRDPTAASFGSLRWLLAITTHIVAPRKPAAAAISRSASVVMRRPTVAYGEKVDRPLDFEAPRRGRASMAVGARMARASVMMMAGLASRVGLGSPPSGARRPGSWEGGGARQPGSREGSAGRTGSAEDANKKPWWAGNGAIAEDGRSGSPLARPNSPLVRSQPRSPLLMTTPSLPKESMI